MPLSKKKGIRPISQMRHQLFMDLLKGTFKTPVNERSIEQKRGIIHFWRIKSALEIRNIRNKDCLFYRGRKVLTKEELGKKVAQEMKKSMAAGARSINYTMKRKYAGVSERSVAKILRKSKKYNRLNAKFTNKPPLTSMIASNVLERLQLDLIDMRGDAVEHSGIHYKYILSILDCFSRFLILRPLPDKTSKNVKDILFEIFHEHGFPDAIQCDNGTEFKGYVKDFCKKQRVKVINSSPYHPQTQGKVERTNAIIKRKLRYLRLQEKGLNWVSCLPKIAFVINSQPKEVLGYNTPFAVYFGRSQGSVDQQRKAVKEATKRCSDRMVLFQRKNNVCSVYKKGETVLLRYPFSRRVPKKRYVILAKIKKRNRTFSRYQVLYKDPKNEQKLSWVSVTNITSLTQKKESSRKAWSQHFFKRKYRAMEHKKKYYIPLSNSCSPGERPCPEENTSIINEEPTRSHRPREEPKFLDNVRISFNPQKYGNCQFDAVANQMMSVGIFRTGQQMRMCAVTHINQNRQFYQEFILGNISEYLKKMERTSTYGDHITLQAVAREYNLQFLVLSALGMPYHRLISNTNRFDISIPTLTLGYYPEEMGEHYVSVTTEGPLEQFINCGDENEDAIFERGTSCEGTDDEFTDENNEDRTDSGRDRVENICAGEGKGHGEYRREDEGEYVEEGGDSDNQDELFRDGDDDEYGEEKQLGGGAGGECSDNEEVCVNKISDNRKADGSDEEQYGEKSGSGKEEEGYRRGDAKQGYRKERSDGEDEDGEDGIDPENDVQRVQSDQGSDVNEENAEILDTRYMPFYGVDIPDMNLPLVVVQKIIEECINISPVSMYTLQQVCPLFRHIVQLNGYHSVYIDPVIMPVIPNPVSVRRIVSVLTRWSGTVMLLKDAIICHPNWMNAWVVFRPTDREGWMEVIDVYWRRQRRR